MVDIALHDATSASHRAAEVLEVWCDAFGPVEDEQAWRSGTWERHRARDDYRLVTADDAGQLVGFAWGYTGQLGQYWSDLVVQQLGDTVRSWVGGHFEFVELAVRSSARGRGIGGMLHDRLLTGLPHRRALLGTADDPTTPASRLYRRRGWQRLGRYTETDRVMGLLLTPGESSATT